MARILIVEDDLDLVETYNDLLQMKGYSTVIATRISEAVERLLQTRPEVIMLDLQLPGARLVHITGFIETAKQCCNAKIVIVSGHPEMMGDDLLDSVDLVLTKPVANADLLGMIDRLLPHKAVALK